jgi:adenosine deaminase
MEEHPVKRMLQKGILATIHSDDPAYFGGYINENYYQTAKALQLNTEHLKQLAINAFEASWLDAQTKKRHMDQVEAYFATHKV